MNTEENATAFANAMIESGMAVGFVKHEILLMQYGDKFRWRRNDGEWVSPELGSFEEAKNYPKNNSFLTDKERAYFEARKAKQ